MDCLLYHIELVYHTNLNRLNNIEKKTFGFASKGKANYDSVLLNRIEMQHLLVRLRL